MAEKSKKIKTKECTQKGERGEIRRETKNNAGGEHNKREPARGGVGGVKPVVEERQGKK